MAKLPDSPKPPVTSADVFDQISRSDTKILAVLEAHDDRNIVDHKIQALKSMRAQNPNAKLAFFMEWCPFEIRSNPTRLVDNQAAINSFMRTGNLGGFESISREDAELLHTARANGFVILLVDDEKTVPKVREVIERHEAYKNEHMEILKNPRHPDYAKTAKTCIEIGEQTAQYLKPRNETMARRMAQAMRGEDPEELYYGVIPEGGFDKAMSSNGKRHFALPKDMDEMLIKAGLKTTSVELFEGKNNDGSFAPIVKPRHFMGDGDSIYRDKPDYSIPVDAPVDMNSVQVPYLPPKKLAAPTNELPRR